MRVLITGATGFIGQALTRRLLSDNHQVTAWVRDIPRARGLLGPEVVLVATDDEVGLQRAVEAADAVANLAGAPILDRRWTKKRRRELLESRINVTRTLVTAMGRASRRPVVLVSASAVGYYADQGERAIDETGTVGRGFAAQLCASWEEEARAARRYGVRVVRARIGIVLGAGGMLGKLLPVFRAGLGGRLGNGKQVMSWIHVDDAVSALVFALTDARCRSAINIVGPNPVRYREFATTLGRVLRRPTLIPTPAFTLRAVLGRRAGVILANQRVVPGELARLGFRFRFPTLEAALTDVCSAAQQPTRISRQLTTATTTATTTTTTTQTAQPIAR